MHRVLIIEDDETISSIIAQNLIKWGLEPIKINNFENIVIEFNSKNPHLILMDINLPFYDGFYWCEQIRKFSNTPIIFISSRTDENDKIRGIMGGGDDYIEKPFSIDILIAKIKAMLRRTYSYMETNYTTVSFANLILDVEKSTIAHKSKSTELTRNECQIMSLLMRASGKIVSRSKIIKSLWDSENFIDENTLTVNINRLRKKLREITDSDVIKTVKGKGYKLNEN